MERIMLGIMFGAAIGTAVGYMGKLTGGRFVLTCHPLGGMLTGALIGGIFFATSGCSVKSAPGESSVNVTEIQSAEQFDKAVAGGGVVLVDFYADWCGPCRSVKPLIHGTADKFAGRAAFLAVNVDKVGDLARKYDVSSIPDVRLFKGGKEVDRFIGVRPRATYEEAIEKCLGGG